MPYDFYPAVLYALGKISEGMTATMACDEANISIPTFEAYINRDPMLQEMYNEADRRGTDAMADALVTIDRHAIYGHSDPKMAAVVSKNIQWLLSKRKTKQYGDKMEVTHNITADKAIVAALTAGRKRAELAHLESNIIDATFEELSEEDLVAEICQ